MNWVGGARARVQAGNGGGPTRGGRGRGGFGRGGGAGGRGGSSPNRSPPTRRLPYTTYDVASDPQFELVEKEDAPRHRTVPLLEQVKNMFPNGDVLSLHLSHVMEIQVKRESEPEFMDVFDNVEAVYSTASESQATSHHSQEQDNSQHSPQVNSQHSEAVVHSHSQHSLSQHSEGESSKYFTSN